MFAHHLLYEQQMVEAVGVVVAVVPPFISLLQH